MTHYLHYASGDVPDVNGAWSVYVEQYETTDGEEPIEGTQRWVSRHINEAEAHAEAERLQVIYSPVAPDAEVVVTPPGEPPLFGVGQRVRLLDRYDGQRSGSEGVVLDPTISLDQRSNRRLMEVNFGGRRTRLFSFRVEAVT
jgi:hypothetical protein